MNFFVSLSLTKIPGRSSTPNKESKSSKLKSSASLKAENINKIIPENKDHIPVKILEKKPTYQTQLTKQIIRTRYDLEKIQTDLDKLKGDLKC